MFINTLSNLLILASIVSFIILFLIFTNRKSTAIVSLQRSTFIFGTIARFKIYGTKAEKAFNEVLDRLNEIDDKISVFKDYSEISRINKSSGISAQKVSPDTYFLIKKALEYSKISEGTFDPTIRPLVALWGIGTKNADIPSKENIEKNLKLVDYKSVLFYENDTAVKLKNINQEIDLGGIAKGYAADEVRDIFIKNHIKSAIIDLGGNIFVLGKKTDGSPFSVGIQDPFKERDTFVGIVSLENKSVVTSGNYERYFIKDGTRYHHIIDPKTGYPSVSNIISATIISDKSLDGDGLSTGIYILGIDKAMRLIEKMNGIDAILISEDKKIYLSSGIKKNFKPTNDEYICIYN